VKSPDVIIAGAGIIGVSLALELRERGAEVLVLDRGAPGQESSSAAAGMLSPSDPETPVALRPLAFASAKLFPEYARKLESHASANVDFRRQGTIALREGEDIPDQYRRLDPGEARRLEPALELGARNAFLVVEDSVDPALLMQAALQCAQRRGVEIRGNCSVLEMRSLQSEVEIITNSQRLLARTAVNCRGAWSGAPVRPRKGQMLYLQPKHAGLLQHVINAHEVYIVPRSSGKILIGATVEDAGYDKAVSSDVIAGLHRAAAKLVPELTRARVTSSWAGLRPGSPDNLPLLGQTDPGIFMASGHFRNGILLAPITARIMAALVMGESGGIDISAFSPDRFRGAQLTAHLARKHQDSEQLP
jgi:glycine oxidase